MKLSGASLFTAPRAISASAASLLLLLIAAGARAQQADSIAVDNAPLGMIDTVIVSGNAKTKAYVILNEMTLRPGVVATRELIEYDRNRIYSLGLFTRVDIEFYAADSLRFLAVDVGERWYILPILLFGWRDGDPKKLYYGGGISHSNWAGRNQKLYVFGSLGYNPQAEFSFADPLFDRSENLYYAVRLSTALVRNQSRIESAITGDYNEHQDNIDLRLGKRFDLYQTADINPGFQIIRVAQYRPGRSASPTSRDAFLYINLDYLYDSRDLREYATRGQVISASATKYGLGESMVNFLRVGIDCRKYVPLFSGLSLATRVHGAISGGSLIPAYARVYLGYEDRIRGYFTSVFEGERNAAATVELRLPILKARVIDASFIPIPKEFTFWRFGISLSLFGDAGAAWFQKDQHNLHLSSIASGYGTGIDFLLPYSLLIRIEYALNNLGRGEFILDFSGAI